MKAAIGRGIPAFNIGGGPVPSRFSQKFGGDTFTYHEFSMSLSPWLHPVILLHGAARRFKEYVERSFRRQRDRDD